MKLKSMLLSILLLTGCSRAQKETRHLSTTEEFNLRGKCATLGKDLEEGMVPPPTGVNIAMSSNYNALKNRCYVTITETPYLNLSGTEQWYSHSYLYDGQTQKQLAVTDSDGSERAGNVKKRGVIFGKDAKDGNASFLWDEAGYAEVLKYIDGLMEGEGKDDR
jgi:hypothetical protein